MTNNKNKLGLFVHWGVYSMLGLHEQAIARYGLNVEEYEKNALSFNPTEYNPEEWVLTAKKAGMKYICFTAKHHDGFCMWDTKYTDYNIMNTKYGRDVLKMLADECKKHGMLLSLYYSCPDWNNPDGYNPYSTHQWYAKNKHKPNLEAYKEYVKNQITELLTNYGNIYTLFWDIPPRIKDESINELVRKLQPGIFINNRGFDDGDFATPERDYESIDGNRFKSMTEACNSLGEQSWGYRKEEDFHTLRYILSSIDRVMAMGGSYLLNAGPHPDGTMSDEYTQRLAMVGNWYNRMENCLEEHDEDIFDYEIAKEELNKYIVNRKNGKSYFHFYNGIISDAISFKKFPSLPKSVRLMNTNQKLTFKIEKLPEKYFEVTGRAEIDWLHIVDIPADELASEPIVLEIEW